VSRHHEIVYEFKTTDTDKVIEISVYYLKGGVSLFGAASKRRGYYISATPVQLMPFEGHNLRSYTLFSGVCSLLEEVSRFGTKRFDHWVFHGKEAAALRHDEIMHMVNQVLTESNLSLQETAINQPTLV
jgi:hypothetical protein